MRTAALFLAAILAPGCAEAPSHSLFGTWVSPESGELHRLSIWKDGTFEIAHGAQIVQRGTVEREHTVEMAFPTPHTPDQDVLIWTIETDRDGAARGTQFGTILYDLGPTTMVLSSAQQQHGKRVWHRVADSELEI